ncbi:glucosamine inositolphosphorylceramide transferase family protein [Stakelama tenebrarum]|uniref:Formyl transferase n=1 Tax=Stakelama tenebrarum TaxID=2711215 RepID=A0A6G6Y3Q2_9SPHN|nr:formyl transferase [Sphingosinithalassobacter tenebrarum]QIG79545.1 formyl transferase [Sphingosinithalassobacter tenebrarum]
MVQVKKDFWLPVLIDAPVAEVIGRTSLDGLTVHAFPERDPLCYSADPFALPHEDGLCVFVEHFDYRTAKGVIDLIRLDDRYRIVERRTVLEESWHLSYPFIFYAEGAHWMLPEAADSGTLNLYRAARFPYGWEIAARIRLDPAPIDATPFFHEGLWWIAYAPALSPSERLSQLFFAFAERLTGPWTEHPANPVRCGADGARPGGTPITIDGRLHLPVQDCSRTYGGAVRLLRIDTLGPDRIETEIGPPLALFPEMAPHIDGCHTLAAVGDVTLMDFKRRRISLSALWQRPRRELARLIGGGQGSGA